MWALLLNPQAMILLGSIAVTSFATFQISSWYYTAEIEGMRSDKHQAAQKAEKAHRRNQELGMELANQVSLRAVEGLQKVKVVEIEIIKEVIRHVQSPTIIRCDLDPEFVRLHEAASRGGMSETTGAPGESDAAARALTTVDLIPVVTSNYAICHRNSIRFEALQSWASGIQSLGKAK